MFRSYKNHVDVLNRMILGGIAEINEDKFSITIDDEIDVDGVITFNPDKYTEEELDLIEKAFGGEDIDGRRNKIGAEDGSSFRLDRYTMLNRYTMHLQNYQYANRFSVELEGSYYEPLDVTQYLIDQIEKRLIIDENGEFISNIKDELILPLLSHIRDIRSNDDSIYDSIWLFDNLSRISKNLFNKKFNDRNLDLQVFDLSEMMGLDKKIGKPLILKEMIKPDLIFSKSLIFMRDKEMILNHLGIENESDLENAISGVLHYYIIFKRCKICGELAPNFYEDVIMNFEQWSTRNINAAFMLRYLTPNNKLKNFIIDLIPELRFYNRI